MLSLVTTLIIFVLFLNGFADVDILFLLLIEGQNYRIRNVSSCISLLSILCLFFAKSHTPFKKPCTVLEVLLKVKLAKICGTLKCSGKFIEISVCNRSRTL